MLFLEILATVVATQILIFGSVFFIFLFLLSNITDRTASNYYSALGWKGILWTAWLGTPIHELSHALAAKLFGHKVNKISLFRPSGTNGTLGYVDHSYDRKKFRHQVGVFFVGIAPLISGSVILVLLAYLLLPNGPGIIIFLKQQTITLSAFPDLIINMAKQFFTADNLTSPIFYLFIYLSSAVASHMIPSRSDMRGFWQGGSFMVALIIIINAGLLAVGFNQEQLKNAVLTATILLMPIILYVLLVSLIQYCFSLTIKIIFR